MLYNNKKKINYCMRLRAG